MDLAAFDLGTVADLTTQVATLGALAFGECDGDQVFEFTIGVVVVVRRLVDD